MYSLSIYCLAIVIFSFLVYLFVIEKKKEH